MRSAEERALGKLNLTLDVLGRRPDGYHEMRMILQTVDLADDVTVAVGGDGWMCRCDGGAPQGKDNLALQAAEAFFARLGSRPEGLSVRIRKRIPMGGGMAGGSSDAAAVLRALNRLYGGPCSVEELRTVAAEVGSDVPFCVSGGAMLAEGRGERLTPLPPLPDCRFVLARPLFSVSTPELFARLDRAGITGRPETEAAIHALKNGDLPELCRAMGNVFQPVLAAQFPEIGEICRELRSLGAMAAQITGTGSVVFGVFPDGDAAQTAAEKMRRAGVTVWVARPAEV